MNQVVLLAFIIDVVKGPGLDMDSEQTTIKLSLPLLSAYYQ
jgi:hypothetical protein